MVSDKLNSINEPASNSIDQPLRHHIWCNLDPKVPPSECRQCISFYKKYPLEDASIYFPDAIVRTENGKD